jgi:hypothetical protein
MNGQLTVLMPWILDTRSRYWLVRILLLFFIAHPDCTAATQELLKTQLDIVFYYLSRRHASVAAIKSI